MAETDGSRAPAHSDLIVSDGSERASRAGNRNTTWAAHELALAYTNAQPVGPDRGKVERLEKEEGVLLNPRALGVDPKANVKPPSNGRRMPLGPQGWLGVTLTKLGGTSSMKIGFSLTPR